MEHYTKDQMRRARKADLYDYLIRNHARQFKKEGQSINLIYNKSLSIKRGYSGYLDFATNETGNSVDFLVRYMGYEIDQAVFALCGENSCINSGNLGFEITNDLIIKEDLPPVFPDPAVGKYRQLFAFLTGRGIPSRTVQGLIDRKLLYQSKDKNNAVFINIERDWAELRGTYTLGKKQFHGVVANCRKDGFWWFRSGKDAKIAYICEASIDAISLYVLHMQHGKKEPAYYISIGGVAKQQAIDRIKRQVKTILAVDNDDAGLGCRERNSELPFILPVNKDWNEDLQKGQYYDSCCS